MNLGIEYDNHLIKSKGAIMQKMRIFFVVIILILLSDFFIAQQSYDTIKFSAKEKISKIEKNKNNIIAVTYENQFGNRLYIYDNNGIEKLKLDNFEMPIISAYIDTNEQLVLAFSGGELRDDIIKSININNNEVNWKTAVNGTDFSISPDGTKLLSRLPSALKKASFQLIDLKNGSKIDVGIDDVRFSAEWLDNQRIVMVKPTSVIKKNNPLYIKSKHDYIHDINIRIKNLRDSIQSGKISKETYNKMINQLIKRKEKICSSELNADKQKNKGRRRSSIQQKTIEENIYSAIIYNIASHKVEHQTELKINGNYIGITDFQGDVFKISINMNKEIYITGYIGANRILVKFNNELKQINNYIFEKYTQFYKYVENGDIMFIVKRKNKEYEILDETIGLTRQFGNNDFFYNKNHMLNCKLKDFTVSNSIFVSNNNEIKFSKRGTKND